MKLWNIGDHTEKIKTALKQIHLEVGETYYVSGQR